MKKFKADYIFPANADPIKNGVITVDDYGKIIAVDDGLKPTADDGIKTETFSGIICPGFINTHCHVELSHLKDKITPHKGLVSFIKEVQAFRNIDEKEITDAAERADEEMYKNGIVAVGDIANSGITAPLKKSSKLHYHTFIEVFGFLPQKAEEVYNAATKICEQFKDTSHSITPHAPYSVSKELFKYIYKLCEGKGPNLLSIHNQESEEENKLYRYKTGEFLELYDDFNMDISSFKPQARNSLQTVIPLLSNKQRVLMVHNTYTNLKDIYFAKRFDRKIHWCFCPNANLYIENRLPKVDLFVEQGFNITLGTDSLASNNKLCILNEMKMLQQKFDGLTLEQLIQWGTINGARFLGIDDSKGTIEPGKTPGLNLLSNLDGLKITQATTVRRLI
ncbi:amidohydrolase family protein [Mucilaginibacter sp. HMF5004]|uniref:amidohydrolase family protein n=1 Tax=Mucilaginibacter rivuli TaxID=2857527 RepID=UPI001C603671|nr:amidohydrolase family protein [Mucilaginibacter rivuli]MBW4891162.1 amidohydrolase family protein [Mucilaginibacter rivuli]